MLRQYAFIAEGDVFMIFTIEDSQQGADRWAAGLSSDPKVVEVNPEDGVAAGWTYENGSFSPPAITE